MLPPKDRAAARSARPFGVWPQWRCVSIVPGLGTTCDLPATHRVAGSDASAASWTYCTRHAPAAAVPIPPDAPYYVTRLELRVAVTGAPGNRAAAADEAVNRITHAIEAAGGLVVDLRIPGRAASVDAASASPLRLQLAGRGEPSPDFALPIRARSGSAPFWPMQKRRPA
jgi:hypothetical protein